MKRLAILLTLACVGSASAQLNLLSPKPKGPKIGVELLADKTGLVPGETVNLAIAFDLEEGWHLYWRNHGEGPGDEPTFKWQVPTDYEVGPMQWPPPRRLPEKDLGDLFVLEGKPTLLATLKVPASAQPGTEVEISVEAIWLVCKEQCVRGTKTLSLKLPVVKSDQAQEAHADVFTAAKTRIPLPQDKAKYLTIQAVASVEKVRAGSSFKVALVLDIKEGIHINSHAPLDKILIPTDVFPDVISGVSIDRLQFPPGREEKIQNEKVSVYRGQVAVILPVQADPVVNDKQVRFSGVVTYQACDDRGCFPPMTAEWSLTLPVAAAGEKVAERSLPSFALDTTSRPMSEGSGRTTDPTAAQAGTNQGPRVGPPNTSESIWGRIQAVLLQWGLFGYLLMALIGGFLLNLMPCVLPVISIKVLSFVQQAKEDRFRVLTLGLAFAGGILLSFIVLGVLIVGAGQQWGGLFQNPHTVIFMCSIVTAFALSLFGVFVLQPPQLVTKLGGRVHREGHLNAFCMGLLATALGTACTAPFLGLVLALAAQQTPTVGTLIFLFAGIGMAAPYVALAAYPAWLRVIPRPGPWMGTFERTMGFLLLATVVWLLHSVHVQLGGDGLFWTVAFLLFVGAACGLYGKAEFGVSTTRRLLYYASAAIVILLGWGICYSGNTNIAELRAIQREHKQMMARMQDLERLDYSKGIPWLIYTREQALEAVQKGYTIFVDYTASWCLSCQTNKRFINTPEVLEAMQRLGVRPFEADFSDQDPELKKDLDKYGRGGVPMYLILPAGRPNDAILLDEAFLSSQPIIDGLEKAGPSRRGSAHERGLGPVGDRRNDEEHFRAAKGSATPAGRSAASLELNGKGTS